MNGQSLVKAFIPLPGGATAVYGASGLLYYRHADWLGSSRLASTPARCVYYDGAYAPFGESYAEYANTNCNGQIDRSFTGQNQDTASGLYDFMYRELSASQQGRWISPDPAGLSAVRLSNPQSLNRYSYAYNMPCGLVDIAGLSPCSFNVSVTNQAGLSQEALEEIETRIQQLFGATTGTNGETVSVNFGFTGSPDTTLTIYSSASTLMNALYSNPLGAQSILLSPRIYWNNIVSTGALQGPANLAGGVAAHELGHELGPFDDVKPVNPNDLNTMNFDYSTNAAQFDAFQHSDSPLWRFSPTQISQLNRTCLEMRHAPQSTGGWDWWGGWGDPFFWLDMLDVSDEQEGTVTVEVVTHQFDY